MKKSFCHVHSITSIGSQWELSTEKWKTLFLPDSSNASINDWLSSFPLDLAPYSLHNLFFVSLGLLLVTQVEAWSDDIDNLTLPITLFPFLYACETFWLLSGDLIWSCYSLQLSIRIGFASVHIASFASSNRWRSNKKIVRGKNLETTNIIFISPSDFCETSRWLIG